MQRFSKHVVPVTLDCSATEADPWAISLISFFFFFFKPLYSVLHGKSTVQIIIAFSYIEKELEIQLR